MKFRQLRREPHAGPSQFSLLRRWARVHHRRRRALFFEPLEDRCLLAAVPAVTLNVPTPTFIGSAVTFTASFDNASATDTGYGPFVDLIFPVNGADGATSSPQDGLSFTGASYLGTSVTSTVLPFPPGTAPTCVAHPYAVDSSGNPLQVCGTPGDALVVLQLPFGSFTPTQPSAVISVTANLSNLADAGTSLPIKARAGFQFGDSPVNDYPTDPTIVSADGADPNTATWTNEQDVIPTVISLSKTYSGPENETATGPNFPRRYTIDVDVATGQTVTNLDVSDLLPNNLAFLSVISTTPSGGAVTLTPTVGAAANPPNNQLTVRFPTVTGTAGTDASVTFEYFVPLVDANGNPVINPTTGAAATSPDQAQAIGDWTPLDPRDPGGTRNAIADPPGPEHVLTDRSLATQKSVRVAVDTGTPGPSPGDTLEYTLQFQVSDYLAFQNVVLHDTVSDGQRFDASFTPTLSVTEHASTSSDVFHAPNYNQIDHFTGGSPEVPPINGTQELLFRVSNELVSRGGGWDANLLGGCVPVGGTGGPVPDCALDNTGPTSGTVVFRTIIQLNFTDGYTPQPHPIVQGDTLTNTVTASGDVLDVGTLTPTGSTVTDTSNATVQIARASSSKSIYAVNGSTSFSSPPLISPGDSVTYRLLALNNISRFESGLISDYLPLPVFDATSVTTFDALVSATAPAAGHSQFGPLDTFYALSGIVPTLTTSATGNSVRWNYGSYAATPPVATTVDVLFTVTASDLPFADGFLLTNQAEFSSENTPGTIVSSDVIVQIELGEPSLTLTKGVVATDNPAGVFAPASVGPVAFTAPTGTPTPNPRWTGTINSTNLTATPINSDLSGVDAGDLVTFAVVVENTGHSPKGAFDVSVKDTLPAGFSIPSAGLNLSVTDGTGTAIAYTDLGGGLFANGLQLVDPGPTAAAGDGSNAGALDPYDPTDGRNLLVITYDLVAATTVQPRETIVNTATLFNYAGTPGGPDFATVDLTEEASVTMAAPTVGKTITGTNQTFTTGNNVAIGEIVTYQVQVTLPEGTSYNVRVNDVLDQGLAFVDLVSLVPAAGISYTGPAAPVFAAYPPASGEPADAGRQLTLDLGTVTNANTNNAVPDTVTVTYRAVVLNSAGNNRGDQRNNAARWRWSILAADQEVNAAAPNVTILEPTLRIDKTASPTTGDQGDTITFTLVVSHSGASNTNAFDITLSDVIPAGLTYVGGSLLNTAGVVPSALAASAGTISATWSSLTKSPAQTSTLQFRATVDLGVIDGSVLTNRANIAWTSLPGNVTTAQSAYNTLSVERTGSTSDPGGTANDYRASDPATVTINSPSLLKTLTDPAVAPYNVVIGQIATYQVTITLPEGVAPNARLVDTLDAGLAVVNLPDLATNITIVAAPAISTSIPGGFPAIVAAGVVPADGSSLTLNFGNLTNSDTNNLTAETIVITYRVVVLNTAANDAGQTRNNSAGFTSTGTSITRSAPNVTIIEPVLEVTKSNAVPILGDAGDPVTFTITVQHAPASQTTAYDVSLSDLFASVGNWFSYVGPVSVVSGWAPDAIATPGGNLAIAWNSFPLGAVTVLSMPVLIDALAPINSTLTNTADLTWTSLPGDVTTAQASNPLSVERTGNPSNPGGVANDYHTTHSGIALTGTPDFVKLLADSSEPSTADPSLTIGEQATFLITGYLPDGQTNNLVIADALPRLPGDPGVLQYVSASVVFVGADLFVDPLFTVPLTAADVTVTPSGTSDVTFTFPTPLYNRSDGAAAPPTHNSIAVQVVAVVTNVVANQHGDTLTNRMTTSYVSGGATHVIPDSADVDLVEPNLSITKTAVPSSGDGGDLITYTITVDHTASSTADAFDVSLADTLPPELVWVGNVTPLAGPAPGVTVAGQNITFAWSNLPLGSGPYQFQFEARLTAACTVGQTVINPANLTYTSLPGTDPNERTYAGNASAPVTITTTARNPVKSLTTTSEASTTDPDVAIGEIARYRLQVEVTEGTLPAFSLLDYLPGGLQFLNDGTALVALVASTPAAFTSSTLAGPGLQVAGDQTTVASITPTFVLPAGAITPALFAGGTDPRFSLGTLVNAENDADQEFVIVEFNALVLNVPANQAGLGLPNSYAAFSSATSLGTSGPVTVTIVEPSITDVQKSIVGFTGTTVTYRVTYTNTGTATAFDVRMVDDLPAQLTLSVASISTASEGGASVTSYASSGNTVDVSVDAVPVGGTFAITYTATLTGAAPTISNTAHVTYTSLPGPRGTLSNPTGSQTPGNSGDPNGERNGVTEVDPNLYFDDGLETLGSLGDLVWHDTNGNGVPDPGELGLSNVTVRATWAGLDGLSGTADDVALTTTTASDGSYHFYGLPPGAYLVAVDTATVPAGMVNSFALDGAGASTAHVSLTALVPVRIDVDFGYVYPASLSGLKFQDANGNGAQDAGEVGLPGVQIYLDLNASGTFEVGEPSTVTGPTGAYAFTGLVPGAYVVREVVPSLFTQTAPPGDSYAVTLSEGGTQGNLDFGNQGPLIIDNGDPGFSRISGGWSLGSPCLGFYGDDVVWAAPQPQAFPATVQWQFTGLAPGQYLVATTWYTPPEFVGNRASNAPFTISGGAASVTVLVDQRGNPSSFTTLGTNWQTLSSSYTTTGTTLTVSLSNNADNYVCGDAVLILYLGPSPAPFPSTPHAASPLPSTGGEAGTGYPAAPLSVRVPQLESQVIPNGGAGYRTSGTWTTTAGIGYSNREQLAMANTCGDSLATWQFSGLTAGIEYRVYATWTPGLNRNAHAMYRLFNDVVHPLTMLARVSVNQQLAPEDLVADGAGWALLGSITPGGQTASVQLSNSGSGVVVADAVLLVPVLPSTTPQVVVVADGQVIVPGTTTVDLGTTLLGVAQQKTFLVRNLGYVPLTLSESLTVPDGFAASCWAAATLAPGQVASFTLTRASTAAGAAQGPVSFESNDPAAAPFTFQVSARAVTGFLAAAAPPSDLPPARILTPREAQRVIVAALERWTPSGLTPSQSAALKALPVDVRDLPGRTLATLTSEGFAIDSTAAGWGWFLDATPWEDVEYVVGSVPTGIDLLTVLVHEIGGESGLRDAASPSAEPGVLSLDRMPAQARRVPGGEFRVGQNPDNPQDVDGNGLVSPVDVLLVVNRINERGSALSPVRAGVSPLFFDVNGDGQLAPQDVLVVINYLNGLMRSAAAEGEAAPMALAVASTPATAPWTSVLEVAWPGSGSPGVPRSDDLRASPWLARLVGLVTPTAPARPDVTAAVRTEFSARLTSAFGTPAALDAEPLADWESLLDVLAEDAANATGLRRCTRTLDI